MFERTEPRRKADPSEVEISMTGKICGPVPTSATKKLVDPLEVATVLVSYMLIATFDTSGDLMIASKDAAVSRFAPEKTTILWHPLPWMHAFRDATSDFRALKNHTRIKIAATLIAAAINPLFRETNCTGKCISHGDLGCSSREDTHSQPYKLGWNLDTGNQHSGNRPHRMFHTPNPLQ